MLGSAHFIYQFAMKTSLRSHRTPRKWACRYCNRSGFRTASALEKHIRESFCAKVRAEQQKPRNTNRLPHEDDKESMGGVVYNPPSPPEKPRASRMDVDGFDNEDMVAVTRQIEQLLGDADVDDDESSIESAPFDHMRDEIGVTARDEDLSSDEYPEEFGQEADESGPNNSESGPTGGNPGPDTWIRDQFKEYCAFAKANFIPFGKDEIRAVRLLHLLKVKNAPMNAYDSVMHWHLKEAGLILDSQSVSDYPGYISRNTMMKRLIRRYNYDNKMPFRKTVRLPASGSLVRITCHDARATYQRLLTDPRHRAKDYLYFDRNPLAPPPEDLGHVADLNTGKAFYDTYQKLVEEEGQQLMPVPLYSDGTAVSHFHDMEIMQVNMTLGIFTREARTKPHCWAPLGYVEKVHEQGGRGRDILKEANHVDTQDDYASVDEEESVVEEEFVGQNNNQDLHAMISVILQSFIDVQDSGFMWDAQDPVTGEATPDIHYKPFVPFVRVDGKEADSFCGKYGNWHNTQHICRKCHIPLQECDDHLANYRLKTVTEIRNLVEKGDLQGLRAISQTYLTNAFHQVRFSLGNDHGIHGSCPSEMLHAFLLGMFKYLRDIFFEYIGNDSEGAKQINALSKLYSKMLSRQSDRTMPGGSFTKGIKVGKLMAKDYRGVLVVILAMLRSTKGREILQGYKNFRKESDLNDWILLVESMLEWESYLNEPQMEKEHLKRLKKKHRYMMYLMRKIAQRNTGMGLKLSKFHMILHLVEDIIEFGVPLETDTSANESMHKPSKKASKMTQRAAETFNFQVANRLIEFEVIDLAMEIGRAHV